jgi:hypothetical protein
LCALVEVTAGAGWKGEGSTAQIPFGNDNQKSEIYGYTSGYGYQRLGYGYGCGCSLGLGLGPSKRRRCLRLRFLKESDPVVLINAMHC